MEPIGRLPTDSLLLFCNLLSALYRQVYSSDVYRLRAQVASVTIANTTHDMYFFSKIHELDPVKTSGQGLLDKDIVSMRLCRPVERFGPVIKSSSFRWKRTCLVLPAEDGLASADTDTGQCWMEAMERNYSTPISHHSVT